MQVFAAAALGGPAALARKRVPRPAPRPTANGLINVVAVAPLNPALGDIWLNPATHTWHMCNGAEWLPVPD